MKKALIWIAVLAAVALIAFVLLRNGKKEEQFNTERVARGEIISTVTATGTVNAVTTVSVGTQVSGTIKHIYVDFNSKVRKGQLIARIDPATFEAQVDQARANLLSSRANLEKSKASAADAKRTMERNRVLLSKDLIAQSDFDTAETNYQTDEAQVAASKAQVAQAEASLKTAETNLGYTKIVSPVDGIVVSRNVDVGQTVAASFQTPTLFTIAQDLTKMQIDTSVDEADIGKVRDGQRVDFSVDAYPDTTFKGKVSQIRIAPITVQNVVTYDVVVLVDNPELKLMPGMTANVSLIVSEKKDVLKVPNAALRFKPAAKVKSRPAVKGQGVWVLENGKPKRVAVTVGISDGTYSEVVAGGLKEGEEVIVESSEKGKEQPETRRGPRFF